MHPSELLQHYGYYAVLVAGLFEGETILMLGAYAVHQGYLSMLPLIACGAAAAFATDQFYFHLAASFARRASAASSSSSATAFRPMSCS